jgi:hypothetical protein
MQRIQGRLKQAVSIHQNTEGCSSLIRCMFVLFPHYRCVFASFIFILFVHVLSSYPTSLILFPLCRFIYWFGGSNSLPFLNLIYRSLNTEVIRGASILAQANMGLDFVSGQYGCLFSRCRKYVINSLIHRHFHIGLVIIPRPIFTFV